MILADTNVFIDAFDPTAAAHEWAIRLIRESLLGGGIATNPVILAELAVGDRSPGTVAARMESLGVTLLDLPAAAALRCADAYASYLANRRRHAGDPAPRTPLPDFFIGAHASFLGLALATSDTARYQTYFPEVKLITPVS